MEAEEQKFEEMTNEEDLDNKLSEQLQFPQEDLNYLCQNSSWFLGASTTESNQRYSKSAAENESRDEGQEDVANMIYNLFQQQGTPEVEVDKFKVILWNISISPQCLRSGRKENQKSS